MKSDQSWVGFFCILGMIVLPTGEVLAQSVVVPDGTLGNERSRLGTVTVNGQPSAIIDSIVGGAQRGQNLFHSFQEFNVAAGRGVYFRSPDAAVQNILARVTGNKNSTIEGTLGTFGPGRPNLFLINPNGIVFGKNASLDVQASFTATTASAIGFGTAGEFSAINPQQPEALLTIDPSAFIFASLQKPGAIVVQSQATRSVSGRTTFGLQVPTGRTLLLLGGDVLIDGGRLNAWRGRVEIGSSGTGGTVRVNPNKSLVFSAEQVRETVTFEGAQVDVSLGNGGDLVVTARDIRVAGGSRLLAGISRGLGRVGNQAGNLVLDATGTVQVMQESLIANNINSNSTGKGGNLSILAESVQVSSGSQLSASTFGKGDAGNILIQSRDRTVFNDASATSRVAIDAIGKGGNIEIFTGSLEVLNGTQLLANTGGTGDAGNIVIKARDRVSFMGQSLDGKYITAALSRVDIGAIGKGGNVEISAGDLEISDRAQLSASTLGKGDAGSVIISTRNRTVFNNAGAFSRVNIGAIGKGGNVEISTGSLEVLNGAELVTATQGRGNAGNVVIKARDRVSFNAGDAFSRVEFGAIGKSGNVEISTGSLEVLNGAQLVANTRGMGDAGSVVIKARDRVSFIGQSPDGKLRSAAFSNVTTGAIGKSGNVEISTGTLEVLNGAGLVASTNGAGDAGNIVIQARDRVSFNTGSAFSSVESSAIGKGGNIEIYTRSLEVLNSSQLLANTEGTGNAGNIIIQARDRTVFNTGFAFSDVGIGGIGKGGNVEISTGTLEVLNGSQLIAQTKGKGDAGNVIIQARDHVSFNTGFALSRADTGAIGKGGNVEISTRSLDVLNGAQLIATTQGTGNAGNIIIQARDRVSFNAGSAFSGVDTGAIGKGGNIEISTGSLELLNGAQFIAQTKGKGDAGNLLINATDSIILSGTDRSDGRSTAIFTSTLSPDRNGGNIILNTHAFRLTDGAVVDARTRNSGTSGDITINANTIDILNGGQVLAITEGRGRAGTIALNANDRITIQGRDSTYDQRLSQFGRAVAPISSSSGIFVQSQASGGAGNIIINSPSLGLDRSGTLSAISSTVDGGNITLNIGKLMTLRNGSQITATAGTDNAGGNGGNITINSPNGFLIAIPQENSDITANAFNGSGGRVSITNQGIFGLQFRPELTGNSDITASSQFGFSGTVNINAPDNSAIQNSLNPLPKETIDTNALLSQTCIVRKDKPNGTFYITGTDGLPNRPSDLSSSQYPTNTIQPTQTATRPWQKGDPIVEPQGFYALTNGRLIMSRECKL